MRIGGDDGEGWDRVIYKWGVRECGLGGEAKTLKKFIVQDAWEGRGKEESW